LLPFLYRAGRGPTVDGRIFGEQAPTVIDSASIGVAPPPRMTRRAKRQREGVFLSFRGLFASRALVWALARRDFTARYKQTALGLGWALLLPLITVLVFGVFVQRFAKADTNGAPYVVWSYIGLIPWMFFSSSIGTGGLSLLSNQPLLNKVHSARQIYPVAGVMLAGVDALISVFALSVICLVTGYLPEGTAYWVPLIMVVNVVFVVGATLLASIFIVYVRDLRNVIPVMLQLGLFATPVVYALDKIAPHERLVYCFLNPMAPMIDSYRRALVFGQNPQWKLFGAGTFSSVVLLIVAAWVFARLERGIVDII
jgi:ABC-type polysaccharide/polyol phosphate export permease